MDCKIIIAISLMTVRVMGQSYQMNELSIPTNGLVTAPPIIVQPPIANNFFGFFPENGGIFRTLDATNLATDPQNINPDLGVNGAATNGNNFSTPIGYSSHSRWSIHYNPNTSYIGTDGYTYNANNGTFSPSGVIQILVYDTNFNNTCSSISYTGAVCGFSLPSLLRTNYYFSVYSQLGLFSNCYYFNSTISNWGKVTTPNQYADSYPFDQTHFPFVNGYITFPSPLTNAFICASVFGSNSPVLPCNITTPTNMNLVVLTNTSSTFQLDGSTTNTTYIIGQQPTNGYITNLLSTGLMTYVETNSSATNDYFQYCTSNSPVCDLCANVSINIITNLNCGNCFAIPPVSGGIITGDIYFNVGIPFQTVCISYENLSCQSATACATADGTGAVKFFVPICSSDKTYCIISLGSCEQFCFPTNIMVMGAGNSDFNQTYYINYPFQSPPPNMEIFYTNQVNALTFVYTFPPQIRGGGGCGESVAAYGHLENPGSGQVSYYFTNAAYGADCVPTADIFTGGVALCGPGPIPIVNYFGNLSSNLCTQCP